MTYMQNMEIDICYVNDFHVYLIFKLFKTISLPQNPSKGNFQLYTHWEKSR
jgi:hypothetical protein